MGAISGDLEIVDLFSKEFAKLESDIVKAQSDLVELQRESDATAKHWEYMAKTGAQASKDMIAGMGGIGKAARESGEATEKMIAGMSASGKQAADALKPVSTELTAATKLAGFAQSAFVQMFGAITAASLAASAIKGAFNFGKQIIEDAGHMQDLADRTRLSVVTLQEMTYVAKQTGSSLDAFTDSAFKLNVNLQEGTTKVRKAVKDLGLDYDKLAASTSGDQWNSAIQALEKFKDRNEASRLGVVLMGRTFKEAAGAVEAGYTEMAKAAPKSSEAQIKALSDLGDEWDAFVDRQKTGIRSWLGELVHMHEEQKKFSDDQKDFYQQLLDIQSGSFGKPMPGGLPTPQQYMNRRDADVSFGGSAKVKQAQDYVKVLHDAQEEIKNLSAAQRAQIDAGLKVGEKQEDLQNEFFKTTGAIALYVKQQQAATTAATKLNEESKKLYESLSGAKTVKDLKDLETAWLHISKAEFANKDLIKDVLAEYEKYRAKVGGGVAPALEELYRAEGKVAGARNLDVRSLMYITSYTTEYTKEVKKSSNAILGLNEDSLLLSHTMSDDMVQALAEMGRHFTTFGAATTNVQENLKDFSGTMKKALLGSLADVPRIIEGAFSGTSLENTGKEVGALIGGTIGGAIGAYFGGPLGAAILGSDGASIGSGIAEGFRTDGEDVVRRVGHDMGLIITEEAGNSIAKTAHDLFKTVGSEADLEAAEIYRLGDLIQAAGGITADNLDVLEHKLHDVFTELEKGTFTSTQAAEALNNSWAQFTSYFEGGRISKELQEIVRLTAEAGVNSKAMADFLKQQASGTAGGFNKVAAGALGKLPNMIEEYQKSVQEYNDAEKKFIEADVNHRDDLKKDLDNMRQHRDDLANGLMAQAPSQDQFDRLGRLAVASFSQAVAAGVPFLDALHSMSDEFTDLGQVANQFGLTQTQAFGDLTAIQGFFDTNQELAGSITGVSEMLDGLYNSNQLSQESFQDLGDVAVENFNKMIEGGLTADQAMTASQDTLQDLWEIMQEGTFTVDDQTKALIDQAEEAGKVGEAHMDAQERATKAMSDAAKAMEHVGEILSNVFGEAGEDSKDFVKTVNDSINSLPTEVHMRFVGDFVPPDVLAGGYHPMAAGGMGHVNKPTFFLAGERGGEDFAFSGGGRNFADSNNSSLERKMDALIGGLPSALYQALVKIPGRRS
jgi:uncharacterized membrane protein